MIIIEDSDGVCEIFSPFQYQPNFRMKQDGLKKNIL